MSADNYLYVYLNRRGKFAVEDRSASSDYEENHEGRWQIAECDTALQAIAAAHKYEREEIVEYGVSLALEVLSALESAGEASAQKDVA